VQEALIQLRSSLARFRSEGREFNLFFRDDDVDEDEDSLRRLLSSFLKEEAPVNLQVIPDRLTPAGASLLLQHRRSRPDLFEINQHGWRHINHEREGRKCEFGPSRNFEEQLADIASGKRVLEDAFGAAFSLVFTPPWNRCTAETLTALDRLGYQGFSGFRSATQVSGYGFHDVSVTLDFQRWKYDELVCELIKQSHDLDTIGIMLHHKLMDNEGFEFLSYLLNELASSQAIKFQRFQSLLNQYREG
jgi:uncharacterized protein DUF2334